MDYQVTVITPCAPSHVGLLAKCIKSVQSQTIKAHHLIGIDWQMTGAGNVRNVLLQKVTTPYIVFLDADDYLSPTFVKDTLAVIQPNSYVYTGWYGDSGAKPYDVGIMEYSQYVEGGVLNIPHTPERVWRGGGFHAITCLIPTQAVMGVGGFDPKLRGMEDTDLFLKLITHACLCPIRLAKPLMTYTGFGTRSQSVYNNEHGLKIKKTLQERYGNKMACCNGVMRTVLNTQGQKLEGDVLLQALWNGNRKYRGLSTGRNYGRFSHPVKFWGNPADATADPRNIGIVEPDPTPLVSEVDDFGVDVIEVETNTLDILAGMLGMNAPAPTVITTSDIDVDEATPDVESIVSKRRKKS